MAMESIARSGTANVLSPSSLRIYMTAQINAKIEPIIRPIGQKNCENSKNQKITPTTQHLSQKSTKCFLALFKIILLFSSINWAYPQNESALNETIGTNFRPGHNVSILAGGQQFQLNWNKIGVDGNNSIGAWAPMIHMRYGFHMNIKSKFGFVFGTGIQILPENRWYHGFYPGTGFVFPSMHVALVQNFLEDSRFLIGTEYAAGWFPKMRQSGNKLVELSSLPDVFGALMGFEKFYSKSMAFGVWLGWQNVWDSCHSGCARNFSFNRKGFYILTGTTWQLGDEL